MTTDAIEIVDSDPRWPAQFAQIAAPVWEALGAALCVAIEHVGSTAVPGLAAKPVIDLDVVIPAADVLPEVVVRLATLGYVHEGDNGIPGRDAFRWPPGTPRHHLYVCPADSAELRRHLLFRDHLRSRPEDAVRYAVLKRDLAAHHRHDRRAYSDAKAGFIAAMLRSARISP